MEFKRENIEVPSIPIDIIEMFINDFKFMKKFIDYKRDGTLGFLKMKNVVNFYNDNFDLNVEKKVRNKNEFFEFIKKYEKKFIKKGLNFYSKKEKNELIHENFLAQIIEKLFDLIYMKYLRKFPHWPNSPEKQSDYLNIELKNKIDIENIRYYYHFQGIIFIQDTKYEDAIKGSSFKVEFNGKPNFQIACFDLKKLEYVRKNEEKLKPYIDKIEDKIIAQNLQNLNLEFDI